MAFSRLGKAIIYQLGVGFMDLAGALKPPERVSAATGNGLLCGLWRDAVPERRGQSRGRY